MGAGGWGCVAVGGGVWRCVGGWAEMVGGVGGCWCLVVVVVGCSGGGCWWWVVVVGDGDFG